MTLGERLKRYRELRGLTQAGLAQASGVGRSDINKLEGGIYQELAVSTCIKLALALEISLDDLAGIREIQAKKKQESVAI